MIEWTKGDILESDCEAIINTVNCVGVMGKGLALLYKKRYPKMFLDYKRACNQGIIETGKMHFWRDGHDKIVINFPTKQHWRNPSQMEWIVMGLQDLVRVVDSRQIKSLAIPPLGCGLGGLHWYLVRAEIKRVHDHHWKDIRVVVYEP
jgi:O-acetyl-ADP-ribose deacetylase (regulator of RNase III)